MKKKISLLICVLAALLCFTGCASQKAEVEYDEAFAAKASDVMLSYCESSDEVMIEQFESMSEFSQEYWLLQQGLPYTPESFKGSLESWQAALEECGAYIDHGDYTFEASADELKVTTEAQFENRNATFTFIYDDELVLDSMTVDAKYTTGEILKKAGLNTLLGMGTVFTVLIFISLIISLFKFIPAIENVFKKKPKEVKVVPTVESENVLEEVSEDVTDDTELVAVIAAAVAAYEGTTTDGLIVRSIKRRPANKWKA